MDACHYYNSDIKKPKCIAVYALRIGLRAGGCLLFMAANGRRCVIMGRMSDPHKRGNSGRYSSSSSSRGSSSSRVVGMSKAVS